MMTPEAIAARRRRNRIAFVTLLVLGFTPLLAAIAVRWLSTEGQFAGTNAGLLLRPPPNLADLVDDHAARAGRWQVMLVGATCEGACVEAGAKLHALPTLLGRDGSRIRVSQVSTFHRTRDASSHAPLPASVPTGDGVYVADPLGNVILYYRHEQAGGELLKDLRHLLKYSSTG